MNNDEQYIADAQLYLSKKAASLAAPIADEAIVAAAFLRLYAPSLAHVADAAMAVKDRQSYGGLRSLREVIKAFALSDYMKQISINLGGK